MELNCTTVLKFIGSLWIFEYARVESRMTRDTNPLTVDSSCGNVRSDS